MPIDHLALGVSDLAASRAFYEAALAPLGYELLHASDSSAGFTTEGGPTLFLTTAREPMKGQHIAFKADHEAIAAFHELARLEGIIPALEPAHALAWLLAAGPASSDVTLLCLSGRGDKDLAEVLATGARG